LFQVCLQLVANSLHVLSERGGRTLTVSTERQADAAVLQISTEPTPSALMARHPSSTNPDSTNPEDGLGLSACQGILQEHRGHVLCQRHEDGAMLLRVELPITESAPSKPKTSTVPVMWQSQPYA
jgi:K+-sensing histidine kinase KdpD